MVLVDLDLRRPSLHKNLKLSRSPGVTDILTGGGSIRDAVQSLPARTEFVITCGSKAPSPTELIASDAFRVMLEELRSSYDIVVVDTPPMLAVTDSSLLAPLMDGVLVVVRCEKTNQAALSHAVQQLRRVGADVLGAVINRAPVRSRGYGYGYQYGYYYSYAYHNDKKADMISNIRNRIGAMFDREG